MVPKLRFKNFEGIWKPKSLKDIACLTSSKRVHLSDYVKEGIPFFRGKEITELKSGVIPSDILYISPLLFNEFKVKYGTPKAGEILITAVGTLGNIYHINNIGDFYFKDGNLIWLKELKCNSLFLSFLLTFKKNEILNSAIGSTQKALTMVELNKLVFNYPRNDEQVKIASFLSLLEEKITLLNKQYNLLCQYKKGMMQKIFSQEVRFKDENGKDFPEWKQKKIREITSLIKDGTHGTHNNVTESDFFLLSAKNIQEGKVAIDKNDRKISEIEFRSIFKNYNLAPGDILLSVVGTIGRVAIYSEQYSNYAFQRSVAFFRFPQELPEFIYQLFNATKFQKELIIRQVISAQPGIYLGDLADISLEIPVQKEQMKIASFLSSLDDKIAAKKAELDTLKTWKQGLLQQMFI